MNKKDEKQFEKWAMPFLKKAQKILLLEHFHPITLRFDPKEKRPFCNLDYPYQCIKIAYTSELLEDWEKKKFTQVKATLLHEMVHPLTDPFYANGYDRFVTKDTIENEREKLTDHIANIILKNNLL